MKRNVDLVEREIWRFCPSVLSSSFLCSEGVSFDARVKILRRIRYYTEDIQAIAILLTMILIKKVEDADNSVDLRK